MATFPTPWLGKVMGVVFKTLAGTELGRTDVVRTGSGLIVQWDEEAQEATLVVDPDAAAMVNNVIKVAPSGGDYQTVTAALAAITDASSTNRYIVLVAPGTYTERWIMKAWVAVVGMQRDSVRVEYASGTGAVALADNSILSDVTMVPDGDQSNVCIYGSDVSNWIVRNVSVLESLDEARSFAVSGNNWSGGLIDGCIFNSSSPASSNVLIQGNATTPQNVDLVVRRTKVKAAYRPVLLIDCNGIKFEDCILAEGSAGSLSLSQTPVTVGACAAELQNTVLDGYLQLTDHTYADARNSSLNGVTTVDGSILSVDGRSVESIGGYSWVNQGSSSFGTNADGAVWLRRPHAANVSLRVTSTPSGAFDYTVRLAARTMKSGHRGGIVLRESSSSRFLCLSLVTEGALTTSAIEAASYTDTATPNADIAVAVMPAEYIWLRLSDDGTTNIVFKYSLDGENWVTLATQARTSWLTGGPNQAGLVIEANNLATPNVDGMVLFDHILLEN